MFTAYSRSHYLSLLEISADIKPIGNL